MNYVPIPTFKRVKAEEIGPDGKPRHTGKSMTVPAAPMRAGLTPPAASGSAPSSAPMLPTSTTPTEYDTTGIGYEHYHDALVNASGGLDPATNTYMSGHLKGMNEAQARQYSQQQWLEHGKAGSQGGMIQKLAQVYGTPKSPTQPLTNPTPGTAPTTGTAPRTLPMPKPAGTSTMPQVPQLSTSAPTMTGAGIKPGTGPLPPKPAAPQAPQPATIGIQRPKSNDEALARRLAKGTGDPNYRGPIQNGQAVSMDKGKIRTLPPPTIRRMA